MSKEQNKSPAAQERQEAQRQSQERQNREAAQTPPKDNVVKNPDTPVPSDRTNWDDDGRTGKPLGATNMDPLGVGAAHPNNLTADPTDTRGIGHQSAVNVTAPDPKIKSPVDGKVPTPSGMLVDPGQGGLPSDGPPGFYTGPVRIPQPQVVKGKTVQLTAPHYINDMLLDAGAVLENYSGPVSNNMLVEGEEGFKRPSTAQEREEIMFHLRRS